MTKQHIEETKWFLSQASGFIFINSAAVYVMLLIINSFDDYFITALININVILSVSIVSGLIFILAAPITPSLTLPKDINCNK